MSQVTNIPFFRARRGQSDALGAALAALVEPTRLEAGRPTPDTRHTTVLHDAEVTVILAVRLPIGGPQKHRNSSMPEIQLAEKRVGLHSACFPISALQPPQFPTRQAENQRRTAKVRLVWISHKSSARRSAGRLPKQEADPRPPSYLRRAGSTGMSHTVMRLTRKGKLMSNLANALTAISI
jgi:hypothetical protein